MALDNVGIRVAPLSKRIVLARFGKDKNIALETRDVGSEFWQALCTLAFDGKLPERGASQEIEFGGGDEWFVMRLERKAK